MASSARQRLVAAAFALFEEKGYDGTTVDEIASRAGTGRTTFFRRFRSKEDVVFPNHDDLLPMVDARLATATPETREAALREAARIVFDHYRAEDATARARYRLTSTVPALRDREIASVELYQRLFARHARTWLDGQPDSALRAELMASAVVTAHNYVLRRWLRELSDDAAELDAAILCAVAPQGPLANGPVQASTLVVHTHGEDVEQILRDVRAALTSRK